MPSDYDEVTILNEGLEMRTSKSGKTRATIRVIAEPLVHVWDKEAMSKGPAQAIAHHFRERIKGLSETAAPATIRARAVAAKAFAAGKPWAMKRYGGGRMGPMAPNQSDRLFNDSGRMAASITANASSDGAWRVNVAANRLAGEEAQKIWARLVALIPEFGDSSLLLESDIVKASIAKASKMIVTKAEASANEAGFEVVMKVLELAAQAAESLDEVG